MHAHCPTSKKHRRDAFFLLACAVVLGVLALIVAGALKRRKRVLQAQPTLDKLLPPRTEPWASASECSRAGNGFFASVCSALCLADKSRGTSHPFLLRIFPCGLLQCMPVRGNVGRAASLSSTISGCTSTSTLQYRTANQASLSFFSWCCSLQQARSPRPKKAHASNLRAPNGRPSLLMPPSWRWVVVFASRDPEQQGRRGSRNGQLT
jgi:hypothetical protein